MTVLSLCTGEKVLPRWIFYLGGGALHKRRKSGLAMKLRSGRILLEDDYSMVAWAIGLRYNRSKWHNVYKESLEYLGGMVYKVMTMERDGNVFAHENGE